MLPVDSRLQGEMNQQEPHQGLTRKAGNQHFAEHIGGKQNVETIDRGCTQHNLNSSEYRNEKAANLRTDSLGKEWPWLPRRGSAEPKPDKLVLVLVGWTCG